MDSRWLKDLSPEGKAEMEDSIKAGRLALRKLIDLLEDDSSRVLKSMVNKDNFSNDWSLHQAHLLAEYKAYEKVANSLKKVLDKTI